MSKQKKGLAQLDLGEKKLTFEDIAQGHTFTLTGTGRASEGSYFWCAFCRGRGKNYYTIRRDDSKEFKVGERCLGLVGLAKRDLPKPKAKKPVKPVKEKQVKLPKKEFTVEALDELLEGL